MTIVVSVVAIVLAAVAMWQARKAGQPLSGEYLQATLQESTRTAQEIVTIVQSGVFAAEQLKNTGRLPDNNAAFDYALKHAQKFLPDLSRETLTTFIESSVLVANQVAAAASTATTAPPPPPALHGGIQRG